MTEATGIHDIPIQIIPGGQYLELSPVVNLTVAVITEYFLFGK